MANALILVTDVIVENALPTISGEIYISPNITSVHWIAIVAWASNQAQINTACIDAAVAAATAAGFTIGGADRKMLMGGAA